MLTANPNRICEPVEHRFTTIRALGKRSKALIEFCIIRIPIDRPRTGERHRALSGCKEPLCPELPIVLRPNYESLRHCIGKPLHGLRQFWIIVVKPFGPRTIMKLKTVRNCKVAPFDLAKPIGRAINK